MGYIDSMYDVMNMETAMLSFIMDYLRERYAPEIELLGADIPVIKEIPSITFLDAINLLEARVMEQINSTLNQRMRLSFVSMQEKFDSDFIFVTHFPSSKPPFTL